MNQELSLEDKIRMNADLVMKSLSGPAGFELGLDARSVAWIDGFIERQRMRENFDPKTNGGLSNTLGCFLGEALRVQLGGEWQQTDNGLGVVFSTGNTALPLNKVAKQFSNGPEDSVLSFYESALTIFGSGGPQP
jgi:hypothetical protein